MNSNKEHSAAEHSRLSDSAPKALCAIGIGELGGSSYGRKLDYSVAACVEEGGGAFFARLQINQPQLMIFRIEPTQVRLLANELTEIANRFDRWEGERQACCSDSGAHVNRHGG